MSVLLFVLVLQISPCVSYFFSHYGRCDSNNYWRPNGLVMTDPTPDACNVACQGATNGALVARGFIVGEFDGHCWCDPNRPDPSDECPYRAFFGPSVGQCTQGGGTYYRSTPNQVDSSSACYDACKNDLQTTHFLWSHADAPRDCWCGTHDLYLCDSNGDGWLRYEMNQHVWKRYTFRFYQFSNNGRCDRSNYWRPNGVVMTDPTPLSCAHACQGATNGGLEARGFIVGEFNGHCWCDPNEPDPSDECPYVPYFVSSQGQCTQGGGYERATDSNGNILYADSAVGCYQLCQDTPNKVYTNFLWGHPDDQRSCWCGTHDLYLCQSNGDGWSRYEMNQNVWDRYNFCQRGYYDVPDGYTHIGSGICNVAITNYVDISLTEDACATLCLHEEMCDSFSFTRETEVSRHTGIVYTINIKCTLSKNQCVDYTPTATESSTDLTLNTSRYILKRKCQICPSGQYSDQMGSPSCKICGAGKFNDESGSTSVSACKNCAIGKYSDQMGQADCKLCTAGKYNDQYGQGSCKNCGAGKYNSEEGVVSETYCKSCHQGFYSSAGASACVSCPSGYGNSDGGQTECEMCPAGWDSGEIRRECTKCWYGQYSSGDYTLHCELCGMGQYNDMTGQTTCKKCPTGRYNDNIGRWYESECKLCREGRYNDEEGMDDFKKCKFCYSGQYSERGSVSCTDCEIGKYQDEHVQGSCKNCTSGRYQNLKGKTECIDCELGKYSTGDCTCTHCDYGQYNDQIKQSTCKKCGTGKYHRQYTRVSETDCKQCPLGLYNNEEGNSGCKICEAGLYNNEEAQGMCKNCGPGKYNEQTGSTSESACKECGIGKYSGAGSPACKRCESGKYQDETLTDSCKKCEAGKYNEHTGSTSESVCKDCGIGEYNDVSGQSGCKDCEVGQYSGGTKQTSCKYCETGKYNDEKGKDICKVCDTGKYNNHTGGTSISVCEPCETGKYNDVYTASLCKTCPNGWFQDDKGQTECETCPYLSFPNSDKTNCTTCEAGKYTNSGTISCVDCELGYYQPNRQSSECLECTAGQYADEYGQSTCKFCPAGFKSSIQSSECNVCQKGKFTPDEGFSVCSLCVQGQYNDEEGRSNCKQCEAGKYNNLTQQDSCKNCEAGEYSLAGSSTCNKCEVGKYQDETLQGSCKNCGAGKYNNEIGSVSIAFCKICESGKFTDVQGLSVCKVCPSGRHSLDGQTYCYECGSGKFSSNGGPCTDCPIGYIADPWRCLPCDEGYSTDRPGASYCSSCRFGKYEVNRICEHCPSGKYSFYGETSCRLCPAGYTSFNDPSDISNQCIQCKAGEYEKNGTCAYCEAGMYNDKTGQTSCQQCPEGSSSDQGSTLHGCDCPGLQVAVEIPHLGEGHCTKFTGPFQGKCTQGGVYNRVSYAASATDCYNDCKVNPNVTNFLYYTDTDPSDNSCWCGTHDAESCSSNGDGWNRYDIKSHWFSSINSLQACRDMSIEYRADHFSVLDNECILGKNGCDKDQYVNDTNWNRYSHTPVCQECPSGTFKAGNSCLQCPSDAYVNDGLCECPGSQILIDPYLGEGYCLPDNNNNKFGNIPSLEACRNLSISNRLEQPDTFTDRFSYSITFKSCILATNNCDVFGDTYGTNGYWQRYSSDPGCQDCPSGSYKASETQCVACPSDATVSASGDSCECPSGAEFVHELDACVCLPGWGYQNGSCIECEAANMQYNNVTSVFSDEGGVCANISCPIGEGFSLNNSVVDNTDMSAHCAPCGPDSFSNNTDDGECQLITLQNCPAGQYNEWDNTKNAVCVDCPSGKFKDSYGLGECSECPEDSRPSENKDTCHCGQGYEFNGVECILVECIIENAGSVSKGNIEYITCVNDTIGGGIVNCTNPIEWQPEFGCVQVSGEILSEEDKSTFVDALQNIGKKLRKNISNECTTLRNEALKNAKEDRKNQLKTQMNRISGLKWWEAVITDNEDFEGYTDTVLLKRRGRPIKYRLATENTPQGEELVIEPNSGGLDSIDLDANGIEVEVRVRGESGKVKIVKHSEESYTLTCNGKNSKTISICGNYTCKGRVWDIGSLTTDTGCVANAAYNGTACECNTNYTNIGGECFCAENYHVLNNECVQCVTGYVNDAGDVPSGNNTVCDVDTDDDGIADIDDDDDDNDGWNDVNETACGTDPKNSSSVPVDTDGDDICDNLDYDIDGDGVSNANDPDVTSPTITITGGNHIVYFISVDGNELQNPNITVCQNFSITKNISSHPFKIDNLLPEWSEIGTKSFTNVLPGVYDYYCNLHTDMAGTITVKQCIIDSNDYNASICSDVDEDTCDDCSSGTYDPSDDGLDTDGDGKCDAGDPDDDNDDVKDEDDHAPLDASVQCTGQTFLNGTKCSDWSVCASGYHETAAPSNTQDRECAASNCVATENQNDDGSDGKFYCLHGNISGTTESCACTCIDGFSGTNCDFNDSAENPYDVCNSDSMDAVQYITLQCCNRCV